jgi:hypothetical protein
MPNLIPLYGDGQGAEDAGGEGDVVQRMQKRYNME